MATCNETRSVYQNCKQWLVVTGRRWKTKLPGTANWCAGKGSLKKSKLLKSCTSSRNAVSWLVLGQFLGDELWHPEIFSSQDCCDWSPWTPRLQELRWQHFPTCCHPWLKVTWTPLWCCTGRGRSSWHCFSWTLPQSSLFLWWFYHMSFYCNKMKTMSSWGCAFRVPWVLPVNHQAWGRSRDPPTHLLNPNLGTISITFQQLPFVAGLIKHAYYL